MGKFILTFFAEIIIASLGVVSIVIIAYGEPTSDLQLYCWISTCLIYIVIASIRKQ